MYEEMPFPVRHPQRPSYPDLTRTGHELPHARLSLGMILRRVVGQRHDHADVLPVGV
jgi:hypothetical protein